jgi:hypothetical protein
VLRTLEAGDLPKEGRRALRRIHHRLRSSGVAVESPEPSPTVATLPAVEDDFSGAWLSPVDPAGGRIAYFLEPHPAGGARVFEVIFDDARGILDLDVYQAPRGRARRFLRDLTRRARFPVCDVPVASARAAVAFASAHQAADRPLPRGLAEWRSRVAEAPAGTPLPGDLVRAALGASAEPAQLRRAVEMVREGRIGPWPPPRDVLASTFERIRNALASPLVVSGATRRGRIDDLLEEAAAEIYGAEGAALAAHRLREAAYVFWRRGDEESARACLAGAESLAGASDAGSPVARALLETALGPALEALAREAETQAEPAPRPG